MSCSIIPEVATTKCLYTKSWLLFL